MKKAFWENGGKFWENGGKFWENGTFLGMDEKNSHLEKENKKARLISCLYMLLNYYL